MILWNEIAAVEGVIATRRLGYGCKWQTLAVLRLAMPMQATVCFHHSCESDLFQVRDDETRMSKPDPTPTLKIFCGGDHV